MGHERNLELLLEVFADLPRQGPGDAASTLRALAMCRGLSQEPAILDMGCGAGAQTLDLARATGGRITAVDFHQPFLDQLMRKAKDQGLDRQITTQLGDMAKQEFPDKSFDLIWCEGAVFAMGFDAALDAWRPWLKPGGCLVLSELTWFYDEPPQEAVDFLTGMYPAMRDEAANVAALMRAGYLPVGSFQLPEEIWWDSLYTPLESVLPGYREKYAGNAEALAFLDSLQGEIDMFRACGDTYGYAFFIGRKP